MRDFSATPLRDEAELNAWLKFHEMPAPLIALGTLITADGVRFGFYRVVYINIISINVCHSYRVWIFVCNISIVSRPATGVATITMTQRRRPASMKRTLLWENASFVSTDLLSPISLAVIETVFNIMLLTLHWILYKYTFSSFIFYK